MAYVSPGVYSKIIDLSEYVRNVPSTIGFIPIISEKGPDNELVFTNARDFYIDFGEPNINYGGKDFGQGKYVADSFLRESDSLYVIRVCDDSATYANLAVGGTIDPGIDGTASIFSDSIDNLNTEKEIETQLFGVDGTAVSDNAIVFAGWGRGDWYNNFKIQVVKHQNTIRAAEGVYMLYIWKRQSTKGYDESTESYYEQFEIDQSFEVCFDPDKLDLSGDPLFVADVVNRYYRDIVVYANHDLCRELEEAGADWSEPFVSLGDFRWDSARDLDSGSDGSTLDQAVATQLLNKAYTGQLPRAKNVSGVPKYGSDEVVDDVLDKDDCYFNIVLDGGYPTEVKGGAVELVSTHRRDCVALLDIGDNRSANEAIDSRRNTYTYNTFYVALYDSYSKIYDRYIGRDIWVTPVYHMANVVPYTDNVSELWYAPAGFNRATIAAIRQLRYSPRQGQRDQLYLEQINPIVKFNPGYTVWGQLTSQKRPTAMQDLNIVRLVLYIQRALEQFCKFYIFEQNDDETWNQIKSNIDAFLKTIQDRRGLYSFTTEVGASEYDIKAKRINVDITLQPVRTVEQIHLNFFII